ncbi:MAG TPA: 4Fe-4S double cluster binding domain-containing protein [Acidimicrobiales bacterium]|nr:4Fe-4S double cluster binding domain-containing protein [Acidimicrobiales bacterium]
MSPSPPRSAGAALLERARAAGLAAGLDAVGATDVAPFPEVRRSLERRKASGAHAGMSFTFRNPRRSTEPTRLLRDARTLVVAAKGYLEPRPPRPPGPVAAVARYAWRDHYAELRAGLDAVAEVLRDSGHRAAVFADDNALVDRAAAHRAGIGWWGKSANLLVPGAGSWFVLGTVVTDAALPVAADPVADGCRSCTRCLDGCPTGAIVAPGEIDARRCLAWLVQATGPFPRQHRAALGDRIYGCDDCQDVCPPGVGDVRALETEVDERADRRGRAVPHHQRADPPTVADPPEAWVDLLDLLDPRTTDEALLARHGRWYVPRRDARYLRRNALVVLGNVGDGADPTQRAVLAHWCTAPDELLRAHAVWAAARLGLHELVAARADDPSPLVRAEVALAPGVVPAPGAVASTRVRVG